MSKSTTVTTSAAARPGAIRGKRALYWVAPLVALLAMGAAAAFRPWGGGQSNPVSGQFFTVTPMDLEVKIVKDGELQAISYTDVKSEVEGVTQIIELVKEGTTVNKGDMLVRLDGSNLVTRRENLELDIKKAESALKQSEDLKAIQESQNAAAKESAEVNLNLAKIEFDQYENGTYPQELQNARTALDMAALNLKNKEEDLSQTLKLFDRGFVTAADVKKAQLDVTNVRNELAKAETALKVLTKYSYHIKTETLKSAVLQAEQSLYRTLKSNTTYMNSRLADLAEKQESVSLLKRQMEKLDQQIAACTITAPEGGLVIYASSIERNLREPIQEGTTVRQSAWLLRLPDVRAMKAVLKVQESAKARLDENRGQRALVKILGYPEPVGATLTKVSVLADSGSRWWNPDLKEYPVELTLDETPPGLKPGTGVQAEIIIDRLYSALAVPLVALYSVGSDSYVFARQGETVVPRRVTVGTSNETHIQVSDGLHDGEDVLLLEPGQGRALLEKAGIKVVEPTTRPSSRDDKLRERRPDQAEDAPSALRGAAPDLKSGAAAGKEKPAAPRVARNDSGRPRGKPLEGSKAAAVPTE